MSGVYDRKPWCTVRLQCKYTSFDKKYYRYVTSHPEETSLKTAAVAAASVHTGYAAAIDYTESTRHSAREPQDATEI